MKAVKITNSYLELEHPVKKRKEKEGERAVSNKKKKESPLDLPFLPSLSDLSPSQNPSI